MSYPFEIPLNFYSNPEKSKMRITRAQLQALLLYNEPLVAHAYLWDWKHKHLGVGIYELWVEQRQYGEMEKPLGH